MFEFSFRLRHHGWAEATLKWIDGEIEFSTSYLSDPIGEMAAQARWIADDGFRISETMSRTVEFLGEPGSLCLDLDWVDPLTDEAKRDRKTNVKELAVWVTLILDEESGLRVGERDVLTRVQMQALDYSELVYKQLLSLYERHGVLRYRERWLEYDFPLVHFVALGASLGKPLPKRSLW